MLAQQQAELDEFDFVQGLAIRGQSDVEVFNVVSLHGGLVGSFPDRLMTRNGIAASWRIGAQWACQSYAQFDNDNRFQGPHQHPNSIGRIIRLCLSLGVVPVFAPPREHGLQNGIESYMVFGRRKSGVALNTAALHRCKNNRGSMVKANLPTQSRAD